MPSGAKFAAATHIGHHKSITQAQPMATEQAQIMRQFGHGKTTVDIHNGRYRLLARCADVKIRNGSAIGAVGPQLLREHVFGIKLFGLFAQYCHILQGKIDAQQGQRRGEIADGDIDHITAIRLINQFDGAFGQGWYMGFVPSALFELLRAQFALHIVQYVHHHELARGFHRFQHAVGIGCKQHAGLS